MQSISFRSNNQTNRLNEKRNAKTNPQAEILSKAAGIGAAGAVGLYGSYPVNIKLMKLMSAKNTELTESEVKQTVNAFEKAFQKSGLKDKVKVVYFDKNTTFPGLPQAHVKQLQNGQNAFFEMISNSMLLPKDKLTLNWFHEMGHAMNKNLGKISKALQMTRIPLMYASIFTCFSGIWGKSTPDKNGTLTPFQRAKNFAIDNIGLITFGLFSPTIIEEYIATHKGEKLAKGILPEDLLKKVKTTNRLGFATYVVMGSMLALGAVLGRNVTNMMRKRLDNKTPEEPRTSNNKTNKNRKYKN